MKPFIPCPSWVKDSALVLVTATAGIIILKKAASKIRSYKAAINASKALGRWTSTPKNLVILHSIPRAKTAPHASPFFVKLETYLRLAGIPYEVDFTSPWSSKGKTPWITLNGEHVADSQLIMDFLNRKLKINLGSKYNDKERAIARTVRLMMDEHFYWGLGLWRYVYSEGKGLIDFLNIPPSQFDSFYRSVNQRVLNNAWAQGIGRHEKDTVIQIMKQDLENLSLILGENKYLLGDELCEEDCSVFGFLVQVLWCSPGSPFKDYIEGNLHNLKQYCYRMQNLVYPDWDNLLES